MATRSYLTPTPLLPCAATAEATKRDTEQMFFVPSTQAPVSRWFHLLLDPQSNVTTWRPVKRDYRGQSEQFSVGLASIIDWDRISDWMGNGRLSSFYHQSRIK